MLNHKKHGYLATVLLALLAFPATALDAEGDSVTGAGANADLASDESGSGAQSGSGAKNAYYGDFHVHTALSFDAFSLATRAMPDDAYRYAKGEPLEHLSGVPIVIDQPLDFLAVTDHAENLGLVNATFGQTGEVLDIRRVVQGASRLHEKLVAHFSPQELEVMSDQAWQQIIAAAETHNQPGEFTTFVAYEWSSTPGLANLHRNVIFNSAEVPQKPFSAQDSEQPEQLWQYMEDWREQGHDVIAIPHNSNASKGKMFAPQYSDGSAIDEAYAGRRQLNEPLVEISQYKGTSETHPQLSPNDDWADFEIRSTTVDASAQTEPTTADYVRPALGKGLALWSGMNINPFQFGVIGSTDTHGANSSVVESDYPGSHGQIDVTATVRINSPSEFQQTLLLQGVSGLVGIWAADNTREELFAALRRKEVFATSGPRIPVHLSAGWQHGAFPVAMGGVLPAVNANANAPVFSITSSRDPGSYPLDRLQLIKGWVENGKVQEKIVDVVCSGGRQPNANTQRCEALASKVNPADCKVDPAQGAPQLASVWQDPDFNPQVPAYYYARVLEVESCRWSSWDALRLKIPPPQGAAATIQERAWSSPVWYYP